MRFTGCTVHIVRPEMDDGPIILQAAVAVDPEDDADNLSAKVLELEHVIYPEALKLMALGRVSISGNKAIIEITVSHINSCSNQYISSYFR